MFKNFGILDKDQNVINGGKASIASGSTVLMSADSTGLYLCDEINESSSLIEIKRAFIKSGLQYQRIVEEISNIVKDEQEEKKIYLALSKIICKRKN